MDLRDPEKPNEPALRFNQKIIVDAVRAYEIGRNQQRDRTHYGLWAYNTPALQNVGPSPRPLHEDGIDNNDADRQRCDSMLSQLCPLGCISPALRGCVPLTPALTRNRESRTTGVSLQVHPIPVTPSGEPVDTLELSVLAPVHNEEDNIEPLVERICEALKDFGKRWELILVDDGSTDGTLARAKLQLTRQGVVLRIIELQRNFGQAAGLQAGIDAARGRLIATLDGDLQNDPRDIPRMIEMLETQDLDMVCGWRKDRQDGLMLRLIPSWIANKLIRRVTGVRIHDYGCGLKLYRTSVVRRVRIMGGMHRFIPAWIASVTPTGRIGEMVVSHHARQFGQSKYGISRTSRVILDLFSVLFFMSFRQRPGHFFGTIGLAFGAISALLFLYLMVVRFVFGDDIGTRPMLLIAMMFFIGAVQMITTGVLAEMLVRTGGDGEGYVVRAVHEVDARNA